VQWLPATSGLRRALHCLVRRAPNSREASELQPQRKGLRLVAAFEASKGIGAAVLAFTIWMVLHKDPARTANHLIEVLHMDRKSHPAHVLFHVLTVFVPEQFVLAATIVCAYTAARLIEAWGLWNARAWAEWFGIVSGALYIPVEVNEIRPHASWLGVSVFVVNVVIVAYLVFVRVSAGRTRGVAAAPAAG
jgi:uncharacterized membrane protein (DUF2068 family)